PTLFFSATPIETSSTALIEGRLPEASGEVTIIEGLAEGQGLGLGDELDVITPAGSERVRVAGIFRFGSAASLGGSLLIVTTLEDGQRWFDLEGRVSQIDVQAARGTSPEDLARRIDAVLPDDADVKTSEEAAADQTRQISEAIGQFLTPILLAFGGVAVLVGAFIIFNAFSMTVAQRRRELAMLRALGASRRQVLLSITGEALLMGVLASIVGLFAGLGVAAGLNQLFKAAGADIPRGDVALEPRTIVVALFVGITVTVLSALAPAVRATRVPPVAALQEGATLPPSRFAKYTPYFAAGAVATGAGFMLWGMYGTADTTTRLLQIAAGAVLVFFAVALLSRYFVGPVARTVGWPLQKLSPISGRLARDNTQRNPGRTAATASALMIGLGVVVFVAVFAQGLKSSFVDSFDRTVQADYVVAGQNFMPMPAEVERRAQGTPALEVAAGVYGEQVQAEGDDLIILYGVDTFLFPRVWQFEWLGDGSDELLGQLGTEGVVVEEQTAAGLGVTVGDRIEVLTIDGATARLEMLGEYRDPLMLNTGMVAGLSAWDALFPTRQLYMVLGRAAADVAAGEGKAALEAALADLPTAEVQTAAEYKDSIVGQVNQLLTLLYVLLAMSVVISLFGIVNTLVLSVYERTREIGMVRAIGSTRGQVRSTVRYESVITSVIGAVLGIAVGIAFAYVITIRFAEQGITFAVPWAQLGVFVVVAVIVGVVAAILPARRAARIDILQAIQYE
ncbi:MAG TPA: FtsX-like permease family protein, partial [Thermoleophilia bacterium]|nr:FtsX-like permease family protein [Thermoleophilia bacterium]